MKKTVISCGPIPARLDSVKFITNRFKGGLAFQTARYLIEHHVPLTVVAWKYTEIPKDIVPNAEVVLVEDVVAYYNWFRDNAANYEAFIMAAAVANLMPSHPCEGKFPSHNYTVGERFDIPFEIAPRAIDIVKKQNPSACLIGYKLFDAASEEDLIRIARVTQQESRANVIFANTPATAKTRKIAVMSDGSAVPCTFDEHLDFILKTISQEYFHTEILPLTKEERQDPDIREAFATVRMFEKTFQTGYGTVAVPVGNTGMFATTGRGHKGGPVLVHGVDPETLTVRASAKATLNAPALWKRLQFAPGCIVVHRHEDDPRYQGEQTVESQNPESYVFPGTKDELLFVRNRSEDVIHEPWHGNLRTLPIQDVDWMKYYRLFPARYFGISDEFQKILDLWDGTDTLEIGGNEGSNAKYAYDPYVKAKSADNLTWDEIMQSRFDLIYACNAMNYLSKAEIEQLLPRCRFFAANTFLEAPPERVSECECAISDGTHIRHTLLLRDDSVMRHQFYNYTRADWESLGMKIMSYGKNSALITYERTEKNMQETKCSFCEELARQVEMEQSAGRTGYVTEIQAGFSTRSRSTKWPEWNGFLQGRAHPLNFCPECGKKITLPTLFKDNRPADRDRVEAEHAVLCCDESGDNDSYCALCPLRGMSNCKERMHALKHQYSID